MSSLPYEFNFLSEEYDKWINRQSMFDKRRYFTSSV